MRPVPQTRFGGPGTEEEGNCVAACFASILELDLDEVFDLRWSEDWYSTMQTWAHGCGFVVVLHGYERINRDGYCIGTVDSLTIPDATHAVVLGPDDEIVHDPNAERSGWPDVEYGPVKRYYEIFRLREEP